MTLARLCGLFVSAFILSSALTLPVAGSSLSDVTAGKLAEPERIMEMLSEADDGGIPVIVEFAAPAMPDAPNFANAAAADSAQTAAVYRVQDEILGRVLAVQGGLTAAFDADLQLKRMDFSPMFAIVADRDMLARLASDPAVLRVHEDGLDEPLLNIGSPNSLERIQMPAAHAAGATGRGWHVAILDTGGRRTHNFLNGRIVSAACFSSNLCPGGVTESTDIDSADDCDAAGPIDGCGHGTSVAGVAAGFNSALQTGGPSFGVARDARIISINVFDLHFSGTRLLSRHSNQIKGLEHVYSLRNDHNIAAVNMSFGTIEYASSYCDTDPRKPIIDQLRIAGIATVIAAGNRHSNAGIDAPACISSAVTVAASTKSDLRWGPSNWNSLVDLVAPGSDILTSVTDGSSDASFDLNDGTSLAAAHVTGAFAALRSAVPDANVSEIEEALKITGQTISTFSAGENLRINVNSALTWVGGQVVGKGAIYFPAPGSMLSGTTVTFQWEAGAHADAFRLLVGSSVGGSQYHDSSPLQPETLEHEVKGLPLGSSTVHVRLSTNFDGDWQHNDYEFQADNSPVQAAITSPTPGSTLPGSTATFQWDTGVDAEAYRIIVGSFAGGSEHHDSGELDLDTLSREVAGLPTDGSTVYVRLFTKFASWNSWRSTDYTFNAGSAAVKAVMTSPTPGSTLTSSSATFDWMAGSGAAGYWLYVGNNGAGSANIFSGGGAHRTRTVTGLPASGSLNVRLMSYIGGGWQFNDYTYTMNATVKAVMTWPTAGSTLTNPWASFTWTSAPGSSGYWLMLGTNGAGSANILSTGVSGTTRSVVGLPQVGTLNVRLMTYAGGGWQYNDYTYTMSVPAMMSTPAPGSTLSGPGVMFQWTGHSSIGNYWLYVGTGGPGSANIFSSSVTNTWRWVGGLPASGTVDVRLMSWVGGAWRFRDYTYTGSGGDPALDAMGGEEFSSFLRQISLE